MIHVIFICTGNICRSAMAEAYLKKRVKDKNLEDKIVVTSAGLYAKTGELSTDFANQAIKKYGADLYLHKAVHTMDSNIQQAEYIIVMTKAHKDEILRRYVNIGPRVHLLKEYKGTFNYMDIDDPWGLDLNVYKECAKEIVDSIEELLKELEKRVKE